MAVTAQDKVFVVNANTNTKYGGVDPTGSFQTIDELKGYKVYTALLTQSGESDPQSQSSGAVEQGVTYQISSTRPPDPWDFSNVGGPKFPEDWSFVATSNDVPKEYGTATLNYDTGAPVVTVLENTIGNIWLEYNVVGNYNIVSNNSGNFNSAKTFVILTNNLSGDHGIIGENMALGFECYSNGFIILTTAINDAYTDGVLFNTPIEIRVYN